MTHVITTTMQPNTPVEVSDTEFKDLTRMGVVKDELPSDLTQVPAPTPLVSAAQSTAAMQAGGAQQEVSDDQEQAASSGSPAQAASE